jgi:hypothetical protein
MNYEADIKIEEGCLDIEWLEQPMKMLQYGKHAAEMKRNLDRAKEKLELVRAELDNEIRSNPNKFGLEKVTDKAIDATIPLQERFKKASSDYLDVRFESDVAFAAVKAFEQRKDALENLVRLHGQQYFAGPKVPRDLPSEMEQRRSKTREINRRIGSTISRTK